MTVLAEEAVPLAPRKEPPAHLVLMVDLASPDGRSWRAVGVGETLGEALVFARGSCPTDTTWEPTRWNDLYGD